MRLVRAAALALPFALAACGNASSNPDKPDAAKPAAPADAVVVDANKNKGATAEMVLGAADAPVTIIEYASTTCPHCASLHETTFPELKAKYIDTGKVKLVFRDFPTSPANLSYVGSMIARCAADRGGSPAYFAVLNTLFQTQKTWISENAKNELMKIAAQIGMDQAGFDACVSRQDIVDLINKNVETGTAQGVTGTPTFVVDGEVKTFHTIDELKKIWEDAAAKAG